MQKSYQDLTSNIIYDHKVWTLLLVAAEILAWKRCKGDEKQEHEGREGSSGSKADRGYLNE